MPSKLHISNIRLPLYSSLTLSLSHLRTLRYQAYDASLNQEDLDEARKWHASFNESSLPRGQTNYSRSSGPGGQHVNKTETKATSIWPVSELSKGLPKMMCAALRSSRYYSVRNDSITIQAQTQRSRTANTDENRQKLVEELHRIYREQVPAATSEKKIKKHEALEKAFHRGRLQAKKQQSSKKTSRKGGGQSD
ncbi:putative peptidyl-tRNA hydrolase domain-containing protein [Rosellinia necatrix]|uniref:Putative peptidyl-tRNA hydrolase domain-containing protein n=1 Tax=Rosellinia necatrix TaxID=77044 RepID=A0A1W2TVS7_ROSNE|nr:putative peptidyl-tRNA hydrolase domain-containing protein [Rosellinia necatrix]